MLTLFRNIRQQLLKENRFTRYLLYALGEIILVVIGILIAIQINSWKQQDDIDRQTKKLLSQILIDLESDSSRFEILYDDYGLRTAQIQELLLAAEGKKQLPNDTLGVKFRSVLSFRSFIKATSGYESMISTSQLQYVKDDELVDGLMKYYGNEFLKLSTEFYGEIIFGVDFTASRHLMAIDRLEVSENYKSLPAYKLAQHDSFKSDFSLVLEEPWAQHFLMDCLNQSVYVFNNIELYRSSNNQLARRIRNYMQ